MAVTFASGHRTDSRTLAMAKEAARLTGVSVYVVQGSYANGSRSAGTHSGGGALDIRTWDKTTAQREALLRNLRRVGFAAWYRTRAHGFDPHIHAIAIGCRDLSSSARNQVSAYRNGRNGLASNGPDDGPRFDPIPTWETYNSPLPDTGSPKDDDVLNDDDKAWLQKLMKSWADEYADEVWSKLETLRTDAYYAHHHASRANERMTKVGEAVWGFLLNDPIKDDQEQVKAGDALRSTRYHSYRADEQTNPPE